jgi:DNA-binding GntR family transcriptional regulator
MDSYGAARGTVRQAINVLEVEGLIRVKHGRGSFVRPSPPVKRLATDRFARQHLGARGSSRRTDGLGEPLHERPGGTELGADPLVAGRLV